MKNPTFTSLDEVIEKALTAVGRHPKHDLDLGYRHAIWANLESATDKTIQGKTVGARRRLLLAILSARKVLPLWEKVEPYDKTPHQCLAKAERSMFEDIETLQDDYIAAISILDNLPYEPTLMAGYSAVKTLATAIWDERFNVNEIDYSLTNEDLDPDYTDSALFASCAYADGSIWEEGSNPNKRRRFWEWWLIEAVPKAWHSFSDTSK
jgi:hypothetical protein